MAESIPPIETEAEEAKEAFKKAFNAEANIVVFAPGRVNLIGEHVDYCEGFVMPMALPLITVVAGRKIEGGTSTVITTNASVDSPHKVTIDMPNESRKLQAGTPKWANYVKGVIANFQGGCSIPAFEAVIHSTVPVGGGLSSSAAIEVAVYTFCEVLTNQSTPSVDKALACQKAEHEFAGLPCGIMDQFISVMGKKDNVLLIDCRSVTSQLITFSECSLVILITNSQVKHELTGSEYPTRKKQCERAASLMKKKSLRDANMKDVEDLQALNGEECVATTNIIKRARHVVSEIERTEKSAVLLEKGRFKEFGECMIESHKSLQADFQVSCPELDQLVEIALEVPGVLGSRMTGGGFGGCTVTLVQTPAVNKVINAIKGKFKGNPLFYICKPSDGASVLQKP